MNMAGITTVVLMLTDSHKDASVIFQGLKIDLYYGPRWEVSFGLTNLPEVLWFSLHLKMNLSIVAMPLNWQNWRDGKEANFLIKLMCQFAELWITSCNPKWSYGFSRTSFCFCFFFFFNWMNDRGATNSDKPGLRWTARFHPGSQSRIPWLPSCLVPENFSFFCLVITFHCTLTKYFSL